MLLSVTRLLSRRNRKWLIQKYEGKNRDKTLVTILLVAENQRLRVARSGERTRDVVVPGQAFFIGQ